MNIPEKLTSFRVFRAKDKQVEGQTDDDLMLGLADVDLPELEFLSETTAGAGIAGEIDNPVIGHFKAMEMTLKWRSVTKNVSLLAAPVVHQLDLRGSIQEYDSSNGKFVHTPVKIVVRAAPKKTGLGKFETGKQMDSETALEVSYLKLTHAGEDRIEIDKYNHKYVVHGVDYLADIRTNIGLEV